MIKSDVRPPTNTTGTFDLARLRFADAVSVGQKLRRCNACASCEGKAAQAIVDYLYDAFRDPISGEQSCVLVRCFQTHPYAELPVGAQKAAGRVLGDTQPPEGMRCLTLLGTRGAEPNWNQPETSVDHRAIPLMNVAMVEQAPMIARLVVQMGLEARHIVEPRTVLPISGSEYRDFGVFHVETALGSQYLPSQQTFVEQYGIRSVVGMGGLLASGEFFAIILFSRAVISTEVAGLFRTLALSAKLALLPYPPNEVFSAKSERSYEYGPPIRHDKRDNRRDV